ncbi:MAG: flagellar filament capping protein FliD [Methylotenera sp.]|nr:flagellar filament capping protein FliD [Methylotenera sp.]MDP2101900.1 flagellar filament capping protein FliD [Methylotenera sp.]MDP2281377.1 flagellar filament capping protein FliD [Methylotenera sp.]MDP2402687.1 flagellar filament capping protein FliD [Methylotenera sp.]MDP3061121.1 flagellar filament capping protein FliD [Methylotenera sp.]
MGISSAGIGSGLDVNGIVTSLMNVEKKPLNAVAKQKTDYQSQISAYGSLKSALSAFQTSVGALAGAAQFNAQTVSSSNTSVFSATSNGNATIGDYAVTVSQLAKSQKLALGGFANTSDVVGTGTLTISFGTFTPEVISPASPSTFSPNATKTDVLITIDSTNNTLAGVRDAINAANSSVSATIVNDGAGNRLVITSKETGEVNSLKIAVADDDTNHLDAVGLSQLAYDPTATAGAGKNLTQVQAAKDAILEVDGIAVVKPSNTITDMIEGVTLNLLTTSAGNAVSLGVASNQEAIKTSVTAFVDAFNKLDTTLRNLTKLDEAGKASGALLGDATARNVINQIRAVMTNTIANGSSLNSLSQIGVSFQRTGQLALDATKLTSAITNNFGDIASLFAATAKATDPQISYVASTSKTQAGTYAVTVGQLGTSLVNAQGTVNGVTATGSGANLIGALGDASEGLSLKVAGGALGARGTINFSIGYAAQLDSVIKNLLSDTGILASRTDGISNSIKRLDKQTEALNVRLASVEARYRAQFTRLDTLLSSMSTTSSFLTQQIASINANRN